MRLTLKNVVLAVSEKSRVLEGHTWWALVGGVGVQPHGVTMI